LTLLNKSEEQFPVKAATEFLRMKSIKPTALQSPLETQKKFMKYFSWLSTK
ncbi:17371_t:CDS:1, partial [Cetraspora pellucida]